MLEPSLWTVENETFGTFGTGEVCIHVLLQRRVYKGTKLMFIFKVSHLTVLSVSLTRTSSGQGFEVNFFLSEVTIKVFYVLYCYHPRFLFSVFLTAINGALLSLLTYYHPLYVFHWESPCSCIKHIRIETHLFKTMLHSAEGKKTWSSL